MTLTLEATYEDGVLKPAAPLPLREHEKVEITVQTTASQLGQAYGIVGWKGDHETLERILAESEDLT